MLDKGILLREVGLSLDQRPGLWPAFLAVQEISGDRWLSVWRLATYGWSHRELSDSEVVLLVFDYLARLVEKRRKEALLACP